MGAVPQWRDKLKELAIFAVVVAGMYLLQVGCPIQRLTGIPCPGCGMTRAVLALLQGDLPRALQLHGMVWSLPLLGLLYLYDGRLFRARWCNWALMALLGVGFALNWVRHFL